MNDPRIPVLHIITRLDPGGSAENTLLSVERVDSARFASSVWTGPGLKGEGPPADCRQRLGPALAILPWLRRPVRPHLDLIAMLDLAARLRRARPRIVHLHSAKAGALGRLAAHLARTDAKLIYTPHGHVFQGYGGATASRIYSSVERRLAPLADAIVGLTDNEVRSFLAHRAGRPDQFCVVPSGVDLAPCLATGGEERKRARAELGLAESQQVIGFIGRFAPVKGPDHFVELAARLHRRRPELRFLMVGDGEMRADVERSLRAAGLDQALLLPGWRRDIPALLAAMDLFTLTSRNEGQGRVLVEAMATGLPVAALSSGGVPEVVVDGETGLLSGPGQLDSLAEQILALLDDPARRRAMGQSGRQRAIDHFSVETMISRLETLYTGLLEGRKPAEILP